MTPALALARIVILDARRRGSLWVTAAFFAAAAALGSAVVSFSEPAEPERFLEAGRSTLYLGAILLCLIGPPCLLEAPGRRGAAESMPALPLSPSSLVLGIFLGAAACLAAYFAAGGGCMLFLHAISGGAVAAGRYAAALIGSFAAACVFASLVLFLSTRLPLIPASLLAILLLSLGQVGNLIPFPLSLLVPGFGWLDPAAPPADTWAAQGLRLAHAAAWSGVFLLAAATARGRSNHAFSA